MWCLCASDTGVTYWLVPRGAPYKVGRRHESDIVLESQSVSRDHAELLVSPTGELTLHDMSRFGTSVNGAKVGAAEPRTVAVRPGDRLTFGVHPHSLSVTWRPLALYVMKSERRHLRSGDSGMSQSQQGGGASQSQSVATPRFGMLPMVADPLVCSHLVVSEVETVARPLLLAMLRAHHIVTPAWVDALLGRAKASDALPLEADYAPSCKPALLQRAMLAPREGRRDVFKGMTFVLPSPKVHSHLSLICTSGGGTVVGASDALSAATLALVPASRVCFVEPPASEMQGNRAMAETVARLHAANMVLVDTEAVVMGVLRGEFALMARTAEPATKRRRADDTVVPPTPPSSVPVSAPVKADANAAVVAKPVAKPAATPQKKAVPSKPPAVVAIEAKPLPPAAAVVPATKLASPSPVASASASAAQSAPDSLLADAGARSAVVRVNVAPLSQTGQSCRNVKAFKRKAAPSFGGAPLRIVGMHSGAAVDVADEERDALRLEAAQERDTDAAWKASLAGAVTVKGARKK